MNYQVTCKKVEFSFVLACIDDERIPDEIFDPELERDIQIFEFLLRSRCWKNLYYCIIVGIVNFLVRENFDAFEV